MNAKLNQVNAKFYDHCINSGAIGSVVAKVRQAAIKENNAYMVIVCWKDSEPFWWNGGYQHALLLASTIKFNGGEAR